MNTKQVDKKAAKINSLLRDVSHAQREAKAYNGYECFTVESLQILKKLNEEITELFETLNLTSHEH